MLCGLSTDPAKQARNAALGAVATVVAKHLRDEEKEPKLRKDRAAPLLVHVDGPGRSTFLETLASELDPGPGNQAECGWSAIRFDAWQHQRISPPWWWLINTLDRDLRDRFKQRKPSWLWLKKRAADLVGFRTVHFLKDAAWSLPGIAALGIAFWLMDMSTVSKVIGALAGLVGALATLLATAASVSNALRRHLLAQSPGGARALLSTTDPMAHLRQRYEFLLKTAGTPIVMLIDNLDRCRADYVVELLEGIQTLLRVSPDAKRKPLVAFVVAADESWLCDSYVQVYDEFAESARRPGRPFGQGFLDKIFDVSLRLPTVPSAASVSAFESCGTEQAVRETLAELEGANGPMFDLRVDAVHHLGRLEGASNLRQCNDTREVLDELLIAADLGPIVDKRLETAYCVQRTSQLLGGYVVDHDNAAIARLGQWAMLSIRWPLLAAHLCQHPSDIEAIRRGQPPKHAPEDLAPVFEERAAVRLARGFNGLALSPGDIRRFTTPIVPKAPRSAGTDGAAAVLVPLEAAVG